MSAPESLVVVNVYGSPELAAPDMAALQEAGLNPYLGGDYYRHHQDVELRVPESQLERAVQVLGLDLTEPMEVPEEPSAFAPAICPDCKTADTYKLPPYALYALAGAGVATLAAVLSQRAEFAGGAVLGWFVAIWLSRRAGKWRCRSCGREWKPE